MTPFLTLLLLLNPPPHVVNHAGQYYMAPVINYYADMYLVPRWWAMATAREESSFRPLLVTSKRLLNSNEFRHKKDFDPLALYRREPVSLGLFQINIRHQDEHARNAGVRHFNPFDAGQSAHVGIALLARLRDYYHGDLMLASAAFNCGVTRLNSARPIPEETLVYLGRIFK